MRPQNTRGVFNFPFPLKEKRAPPSLDTFGVLPVRWHHLALPRCSPFTPQRGLCRLSLIFYPACLKNMQRKRLTATLLLKWYSPVNNESVLFFPAKNLRSTWLFPWLGVLCHAGCFLCVIIPQSICTNQGHSLVPLFAHQQLWRNPSITRGGWITSPTLTKQETKLATHTCVHGRTASGSFWPVANRGVKGEHWLQGTTWKHDF